MDEDMNAVEMIEKLAKEKSRQDTLLDVLKLFEKSEDVKEIEAEIKNMLDKR